MANRIQFRRGTAVEWSAADPVLHMGELGYETDTNSFKIGDGVTSWSDLTFFLTSSDVADAFAAAEAAQASADDAAAVLEGLENSVPAAFSVVTFGAVGDGTTDDTEAIQFAIDTVTANGGGQVYFPSGIYLCGSLTIPQCDGLIMRGDSAGASILRLSPGKAWDTTPWVTTLFAGAPTRSTKNLVVEHLTFDGNAANRPGVPRWLQTPTGVTITDPQNDYFANGGKIGDPAHAASAAAVAASQSLGSAGNLTLTSTTYTPSSVRKVTITSTGNDSARTFTVTGTDYANAAQTDAITGSNGGTATGAKVFKTITQIAVDGATAGNVTAGVAAFDIFGTVAEGRRNPNRTNTFALLRLRLCEDTTVRNCRFINHKGWGVFEAGGKNVTIERNVFDNVGKSDGDFVGIWTSSYLTPGGGDSAYQDSEDIKVRDNVFRNSERFFCTFAPTKGGVCSGNVIENTHESGIFVSKEANYSGGKILIERNTIRTVRVSDIVGRGIELNTVADVTVRDNFITDTDMHAVTTEGTKRVLVEANHFYNCSRTYTLPYGPFSERYAFAIGTAPVAGTTYNVTASPAAYISVGTLNGVGCKNVRIRDNHFHEDRGSYPSLFAQVKSITSNIAEDVSIEDNSLDVPSGMTFLDTTTTAVWTANMPLHIRGNIGHASESPVVVTKAFAAGETGAYTATVGFRPRLVEVYAADNNASLGRAMVGAFSWNRAAARNDYVEQWTSVSGTGQQAALAAANLVVKLTDAAGTVTASVGFTSWKETGFTLNATTMTNAVNVRFVCEP